MTSPAEGIDLRKDEGLFYTLAGNKLGKLRCRQVMGDLERLLKRKDYTIQWLSSLLLPLGASFSALTALTEFHMRSLPLRAWSCFVHLHLCDPPLALPLLFSPSTLFMQRKVCTV